MRIAAGGRPVKVAASRGQAAGPVSAGGFREAPTVLPSAWQADALAVGVTEAGATLGAGTAGV